MKKLLKKLPFFSKLFDLAEQVHRIEKQLNDLESSLNGIFLGGDADEILFQHICRMRRIRIPNLRKPKTFNEKILWLNFYHDFPLKRICADKYAVREWVAKQIGDEYLVPLLGVWDSFDKIDFSKLPDRFVLKPTHASGCNIIVRNKKKMNLTDLKEHFDYWLSVDYSRDCLEKCYQGIPPQIIAEEYLETSEHELPDYKFFCIHGKPQLCWIDLDRETCHKRNVYDTEWNLLPLTIRYPASSRIVPKPKNFSLMLELAEKLSAPFIQVRVDFYNIAGKIYFGELTFVSGGGCEIFTPESYALELGEKIHLPERSSEKCKFLL